MGKSSQEPLVSHVNTRKDVLLVALLRTHTPRGRRGNKQRSCCDLFVELGETETSLPSLVPGTDPSGCRDSNLRPSSETGATPVSSHSPKPKQVCLEED